MGQGEWGVPRWRLPALGYWMCIFTVAAAGMAAPAQPPGLAARRELAAASAPALVSTVGARQRAQCIAHSYPVFDPAGCDDGWDCKVYLPKTEVAEDGTASECRCCMEYVGGVCV
jgi:hypothetical protein